ncbi:hypothetical protein PDJAM_G00012810 [Pangasius djambal]|uniref:Uncharacterized protein n=1 Tax=Pangasius djambal TaxID=1691987 RepID=A0ACC5YLZ8_9TELE|nr:hypothetical protein [Pangasius djambal]
MMESCFNDKVARAETILVEDLRRDLRFDLTEIAEAQDSSCLDREFLQVYLRIRPFSQAEIESGESQDCVTIHPPDTVLLKAPRSSLSARASDKSVPQTAQRFQFSQVFGADTSQKDLFDGTVRDLVRDVLEGKNSLVFTYGVTNAGKTFTFLGLCFTTYRHHTNDTQKNTSSLSSSSRSEGSDLADPDSSASDRSFSVDADPHTRFSVWVSFCEIYNENIHDLLEQPSGTGTRRANLRLCQDTKGNSFIKDLRWVQVNSSDEAFKVMKLGKKNQSISSTKLNQLSSRSHSIFTVRILRIEDVASVSVQSVSELSLCDLAGSERCGKTQNKGDRLKEAGNINTSLLSLGKCINALKGSQQARQHVPFRESKLTHYLQGFFTGRGRAAMIVNVNQCASMYDETLNVLKFSAVAQKVVVLSVPSVLPLVVKRSAREVSFIINKATQREARRTSLVRWEHGRVDGNENEVSEEEDEEEEEESLLEETLQEDEGKETVLLDKEVYENQLLQLEELQEQLRMARAETVAVESRIREEVTKEFSELFTQMQNDYNERISKERELVEERCERRLQIFKQLVEKTTRETRSDDGEDPAKAQEREPPSLDGMFDSMSTDLAGIRKDAEAAQSCLVTCDGRPSVTLRDLEKKVTELTEKLSEAQKQLESRTQELDAQSGLAEQLEDMRKTLQSREQRLNDLMVMCVEKDDIITKVQAELDRAVEEGTKNSALIKDLLQQKRSCTCSERRTHPETRKRRQEGAGPEDIHGQPPLKKGTTSEDPEEEEDEAPMAEVKESPDVFSVCGTDSSMTEVKGQVDRLQTELRQKDERISDLERERQTLEFCIQELKSALEEEKRSRAGFLQETEQKIKEEQQRKFHSIITRMSEMEEKLSTAEKNCAALRTSKMEEHGPEIEHRNTAIKNLEQEVTRLQQEAQNFGDVKATRDEVSRLQKENESKAERVKILEQQLTENKNLHENLQRANFDLQAEVTNLKGVIKGLEEKAALLVKESTLKLKEKTETELSDREAQLAKREAELAAVQEEAQEARKREVERRRELLAVAKEAIAQKDAELQKREAEITRLKEEMKCSSEKLSSLSLDTRRREDESSDLREKLADSKKQIQQVQREICSMRDVEKSLKQKLSDVEKTKSQLQSELSSRDRTIQQLRSSRSSDSKTEDHVHLYEKALRDLQERQGVIEEMRLVLSEQEETQTQMDLELESRETQIHQLTQELDNLKELLLKQRNSKQLHHHEPAHSDDITRAKEEAAQAQDNLKMVSEKHQAERRKWTEEKLVLIAQAKDAEERRNQDMRRYAEDRERHARQHTEMESLKARLAEREQEMDEWRKERDTLVSALEVQLKKLVSTIVEKDEQIRELKRTDTLQPPEVCDSGVMEQLKEKEAELNLLREQLRETKHTHPTAESSTQKRGSSRKSKARTPQDGVESENRRNMRCKKAPSLPAHQEEEVSPALAGKSSHDSQVSLRGKKEGKLQKIGDFLNSSPTFLGSKAKRIMGLMSGRSPDEGGSSLSLKRSKRKINISSPMNISANQIISRDVEEREDQLNIKKRLRTKTPK